MPQLDAARAGMPATSRWRADDQEIAAQLSRSAATVTLHLENAAKTRRPPSR